MDDIGRVIKLAGAREAVPAERLERVRQNVRTHWHTEVEKQQMAGRTRRFNIYAIAAGLILVAGATLTLWRIPNAPTTDALASVERVLGVVQIHEELANRNSEVGANALVRTGDDGRIALRMSGGQSLRIDTSSHVILHSPNHVTLKSGAIYIDTALVENPDPILVSTPLGTAQDIGTQFQVRVTGMMMVVGVREGLVEVSQPGQQNQSVNKGNFVELVADGQSAQHALPADHPGWDWIETVTPEFDIEGATLAQYLGWYTRERGLKLAWADALSESRASTARLSGSIAGNSLDEGLQLVKQVAPFEHRLSGDTLWVEVK